MTRFCIQKNCKKRSSYGLEDTKSALYCASHKLYGMINVVNNKCKYINCQKQPIYGIEDSKIAEFCLSHKQSHMVNVKNKKCIFNGCKLMPNYAGKGSKTALYCVSHKSFNMIDVKNKKCIYNGCDVRATYGIHGTKNVLYCVSHKLSNMSNITNKKCIYNGCDVRPTYGIHGTKKALYCVSHKLSNMTNITNKKCIYDGCDVLSTYGIKGTKTPLYCVLHKESEMVNVLSKFCIVCNIFRVNYKYKDYCSNCYRHNFPDDKFTRTYKSKELLVVDYIKNNFPNLKIINDKIIGSSKCRPDIYIDFKLDKSPPNRWALIIEIDENQHNDYLCEQERMQKLLEDNKFEPITFIRFNPDKYIDHKGIKNTNCFHNTINGTILIKKQKDEWDLD